MQHHRGGQACGHGHSQAAIYATPAAVEVVGMARVEKPAAMLASQKEHVCNLCANEAAGLLLL